MATAEGEYMFPVYVVYSKKTIDELTSFFKKYGKGGQLGKMHVQRALRYDYDLERKIQGQTNQTICIFTPDLAQSLITAGFGDKRTGTIDFAFSPYYLHEGNYPKEGEETHELYVALPNSLTIDKCRAQLERYLNHYVKFDILPKDSFWISIPFADRITGKHLQKATIKFKPEVSRDAIAITRVLLHDASWENEKGEHISYVICLWAHHGTSTRESSHGTSTRTGSRYKNTKVETVETEATRDESEEQTNGNHVDSSEDVQMEKTSETKTYHKKPFESSRESVRGSSRGRGGFGSRGSLRGSSRGTIPKYRTGPRKPLYAVKSFKSDVIADMVIGECTSGDSDDTSPEVVPVALPSLTLPVQPQLMPQVQVTIAK